MQDGGLLVTDALRADALALFYALQKKEIVLGINSDAETMTKGTNNNIRLFSYSDDTCVFLASVWIASGATWLTECWLVPV